MPHLKGTKRKRLAIKALFFAIPFLMLSIAITGVILSITSYSYFLKTINQDYRNIIKGSTGEILLYMQSARNGLESLAWIMTAIKPDPWQKKMALTAFNHIHPEFLSLSMISNTGENVVSTGVVETRAVLGQSDTIEKALSGQKAVSHIMFNKEAVPYVHMAVPIMHLGKIDHVLLGELNLKSVWDVLESVKIGDTGKIFITDLTGRIIGDSEIQHVINSTTATPISQEALIKINGSPDPVEWNGEREGVCYYFLGYAIPDLDWIIVLGQTSKEIYVHVYRSIYLGIGITVFICLIAGLLGWNTINRFLAPIHEMHHQVQQIGLGNLNQKVSVNSQDEIGDLCVAFNEMTSSLKTVICREVEKAKELSHAKSLAMLGVTFSKVTHEVKNFLNNISIAIVMLKGESLSLTGRKTLEVLERESVRVNEFIRDSLQFAKKPEVELERISLDKPIREVFYLHSAAAKDKGVKLQLEWPSDLPPVSADFNRIYEVFNNLIKNSLDAMTQPGSITVKGIVDGEYLLINIEDTGPGIKAEIQDKVFEPFFTTKGKKGAGLGLAICQSILEAHRGKLEFRSESGIGTVFTLKLPLL
jgi:two-component system NtrC family sensor kinase